MTFRQHATIGQLVPLGCFVIMGHFEDILVRNIYCHHIGVTMAAILENTDFRVIETIKLSYKYNVSMTS